MARLRWQLLPHLLPLAALAFMLGIALAARAGAAAPPALTWGGVALALLACIKISPDRALVWAVLPLFCCAGFLHARFALDRLDGPGHIGAFMAESADASGRVRATLAGRILDMVEYDGTISRCTLAVEWALPLPDDGADHKHPQKIQKISGKAALRIRGRLPEALEPGDTVLALGMAERPKMRPGGASWQYAARGAEAIVWLKSPEALKPLPAAPIPQVGDSVREPEPMGEPAKGTAGEIKLYDVSDKDAAMIMAIVASQMGKPLNELRFKSIKEVK